MPADTRTLSLGALQMATGNDNNNWGDNFNSDILAVLERAHCGVASRAVTGGTLDLSGNPPPTAVTQVLDYFQIFTGSLTSDLTVVLPNKPKSWKFHNRTNGNNFNILLKTPNMAAAAINIPEGTIKEVYCDGADGLFRSDHAEIGIVEDHPSGPVPGYMECAGQAVSRTRFPELFAKIGIAWGAGNGSTTFNVPNLFDTGRFRRSRSSTAAVGTYQGNQLTAHNHSASLGGSTDTASGHNHTGVTGTVPAHQHGGGTLNAGAHAHTGTALSGGAHNHTVGGGSGTTDVQGAHSHGGQTGGDAPAHQHNTDIGLVGSTINVQLGSTPINQVQAGANARTSGNPLGGHVHGITVDGAHAHNVTVDTSADHTHTLSIGAVADHAHGIGLDNAHNHTISTDGAHSHGVTVTGTTGTTGSAGETRPEAAVFIACIRY